MNVLIKASSKIIRIFIFACIAIVFKSCGLKMDKTNTAMYAFEKKFSLSMQKKYHLEPFGRGGGYKEGKVKIIDMSFKHAAPFDIPAGRSLIVNMAKEILVSMNLDKDLYEVMYDKEATLANIELGLIAYPNINDDPALINVIFLYCGCISYKKIDPISGKYIKIMEETFMEAEKMLNDSCKL